MSLSQRVNAPAPLSSLVGTILQGAFADQTAELRLRTGLVRDSPRLPLPLFANAAKQ